MRIAVDAREIEGHPTGVGRVLEGLLGAWPEGDRLTLITRRPIRPRVPLRAGWEIDVAPGPGWMPGVLWEQTVLPGRVRAMEADVLVSPAYGMPRRPPCPAVVGMHDCAFAALPETFTPRERLRRRWVARIAARRAAFLFMGSEFAADEAASRLGVDRARLRVLPYGVDERFRPAGADELAAVRERLALTEAPLLFVGSHLQRRGMPGLAAAVDALARRRPGAEVCHIGARPERAPEAGRWLGYVEDADLPALLTAAAAVLYPSRYEGFGLPVMEALACGTPVLTTDGSSLREVYAGRARLLPGDDVPAWVEAAGALLDDPARARKEVLPAAGWARGRAWDRAAGLLHAAVHDAGGGR